MPHPSERPWPNRRTYAACAAAAVLFAAYGSFVPFELRPVSFDEAIADYAAIWGRPLIVFSRSDVVANVLLAVPVGFFLMGALTLHARSFARFSGAALTLVAGIALGFLLEFGQIFFRARIVSPSDVVAQGAGTMTGIVGWLLLGQAVTDALHGLRPGRLSPFQRRLQGALAIYALGWFISMLMPLELSLSPSGIFRKLRDGEVVLIPFSGQHASRYDLWWDVLSTFATAIPLGAAMMLASAARGGSRGMALLFGTLFVTCTEFVQILVVGRVVDVTDALVGALGVGLGIWLTICYVTLPGRPDPTRARPGRIPLTALASAVLWCGAIAFYHWKPFRFDFDAAGVRQRLAEVSLLPLRQYQHDAALQLLAQGVLKAGLGIPLGLFLGQALAAYWQDASYGPTLRWMIGLGAAVLIFGAIETGQLLLPDRVPDVTDVLFGLFGASLGLKAVTLFPAMNRQQAATSRD